MIEQPSSVVPAVICTPAAVGRQSQPHKTLKYRPDIDGLRAVAILAVVAYHTGLGWAKGGFVGVDVFFVISGYLIGSLVYGEILDGTFSIAYFYGRRAKRLLPALFGILTIIYLLAILLLDRPEMRQVSKFAAGTITSTSNIFFWRNISYFAPDTDLNPLLMAWSLSVEEQFYVLFPAVIMLLRSTRYQFQLLALTGMTVLSLTVSIAGTPRNPEAAFYLLPFRGWELAAGVLLALIELRRDTLKRIPPAAAGGLSLLGVTLIGVSIAGFDSRTPFPGYAAILPVVGSVFVIAARRGIANRVLSNKQMIFVGRISYSWYLWHWPLLSFARISSDTGRISTITATCISLLSFVCAAISWKILECPFRRSTTPPKLALRRYGALAVAMLIIGVALHYVPDVHSSARKIAATNTWRTDSCLAVDGEMHPRLIAPCMPAGNESAVALVGDSHAAALSDGLGPIVRRSGFRLVEMDKTFCPALDGVTNFTSSSPSHQKECAQYNRERMQILLRDPSIRAVVVLGYWAEPFDGQHRDGYVADGQDSALVSNQQSWDNLQTGIERLVSRLTNAGKTVYLCQDNPHFATIDPWRYTLNRLIFARGRLAMFVNERDSAGPSDIAQERLSSTDKRSRSLIAKISAARSGVRLADLRSTFCQESGCRFAQGEYTLFTDRQHLSSIGAQIAAADIQLEL